MGTLPVPGCYIGPGQGLPRETRDRGGLGGKQVCRGHMETLKCCAGELGVGLEWCNVFLVSFLP